MLGKQITIEGKKKTMAQAAAYFGCEITTMRHMANKLDNDNDKIVAWGNEYIKRRNTKCPVCGKKAKFKYCSADCRQHRYRIDKGQKKREPVVEKQVVAKKVKPQEGVTKETRPVNCNNNCARYMHDDCPGIDVSMLKARFKPTKDCFRPVKEESMEQIRGRALRNV